MRQKLYLGLIIILLAIFGKALEQDGAPNQQIVIQFSNLEITKLDANNTIDAIRKRLKSIGVEQIKIAQDKKGQLKITYYSTVNVLQIKTILSKDSEISFAANSSENKSSDFPNDKNLEDYQLSISEIQEGSNSSWDFDGVQLTDYNQKIDRFSKPKNNTSHHGIRLELTNQLIKVVINTNETNSLLLDTNSYKIPEVRAGPSV
ncbi:hypothetical protein [Winogradskyella sp. PE311]|uniref:hypothetical protein n=1 Tax=Winogradskyella sp. PE311 TaxID=3366943 RepID=UPI00397EA286